MVTPETLIARMGDDAPGDGVAASLIAAATAYLERMTSKTLGDVREVSRHYLGDGTSDLWLEDPPSDQSAVEIEVTEATAPGEDPEEITDFVARGSRLVRTNGGVWSYGYEYECTYEAGYVVGEGPEDFQEAVLQLAAYAHTEATRSGIAGETIGDYSYYLNAAKEIDERLPFVASVIAAARRVRA